MIHDFGCRQFLIFIFAQALTLSAFAASNCQLFVWQPQDAGVAMVLPRFDDESPAVAARRYMGAFNANRRLVQMAEDKLKYELDGFSEFSKQPSSDEPLFVVVANEPAQSIGPAKMKSWYAGLVRAGAKVYVLPTVADAGLTKAQAAEFRRVVARSFDGMLALGGSDVDPALYGAKNQYANDVTTDRDESEAAMLSAYIGEEEGTCFGICRGMQLIAITQGYKLIQDIGKQTTNKTDHKDDHQIEFVGKVSSILRDAFRGQNSVLVNSVHHQAVIGDSKKNGSLLELAVEHPKAADEENILEAMQFRNGRGFLVQFHPERMKNDTGRKVMGAMVDVAREFMPTKGSKCARKIK